MNFNVPQWFDVSSIPYILFAICCNSLIVYLWQKKVYKTLGLKTYEAIQKIHLTETPRFGGFIILITLSLYIWFHAKVNIASILKPCLISLTPLALMSFKEDIFHNVSPFFRLTGLLLSGIFFVTNYSGPYPHFEENKFEAWLNDTKVWLIFYPLALSALANGSNLTDGVNGLCSVILLSILGSLLFLAYQVNDEEILMSIWALMSLIIVFLAFNYPFGTIFLGDLGAYAIAFLTGMFTIIFFGRHPEVSPWFPVLIFAYPITEVTFSILRRCYHGQSVFVADTKHLHIKIFYFLRKIPKLKSYANVMVMPILALLWIYPLITIPWAFKKPILINFFILFFLIIYAIFYRTIPE